ncbi:MAG: YeeE/YedE family protein [Nanoarchaeota archaeon]|nr:YeeE/YedE family protein [Nanoarchaeota archaeon]
MKKKFLIIIISGLIFGFGLALSGMAKPEVVLSFLQLKDLGLLFVLLPAAILAGFSLFYFKGKKAPMTNLEYGMRRYPVGRNTIIGGILFGLGWGISGACPGAAYASIGIGNYPMVIGVIAMMLGAATYHLFAKACPDNIIVKHHDR